MRFILIIVLSILAGPSMAETFQGREIVIVDGRRSAAPAPVVIAMNGYLGTGRDMRRKTSFAQLARSHGFVAVFPNGVGRRWYDGRRPNEPVDDVAYLSALVAQLVADGRADPTRVFFAGHSNGGGMAMRMACDRPDLVAGIAVAATKLPQNYSCRGGAAVPAIFFYGSVDPISPPEGRPQGARLGATVSQAETLAIWARRNGCGGVGSVQGIDAQSDGTSVDVRTYGGCRAPLIHVEITGHGHGWPGAGPRLPRVQGPATSEIDAAALSWNLFSQL